MDRTRRTLARIPGLSLIAAAGLTVVVEAAIGIGASLSLASGAPSLPNTGSSGVSHVVSSVTNTASSVVSTSSSAVSGAASTATHSVAGAVSGTQQRLVSTASNLSSTASSVTSTAGQVVSGATSAASTPGSTASSGWQASSGTSSAGSGSSSTGRGASSGGHGSASDRGSGSGSSAARHQWYVRRLVLRLSGCVGSLPRQSQQVLVLAAGIGNEHPDSASRVARILHITVSREQRVENSAVTALQRASTQGSCESSGNPLPVSAVAVGSEPGLALLSGPQTGAQAFIPAARALAHMHPKRAVRAMHLSRRHRGGGSRVEKSSIGTPSAAGSVTSPWVWVLLGLFLAGGSALIGRQRLRTGRSSVTVAPSAPASASGASTAAEAVTATAAGAGMATVAGAGQAAHTEPDHPGDEPAPLSPNTAPVTPAAPDDHRAAAEPATSFPAAPVLSSAGRPRARAGRNWLRRHRQASAMVGAVAGGALALVLSAAGRPARMVTRRRRRPR
jgi:hypothetical protein